MEVDPNTRIALFTDDSDTRVLEYGEQSMRAAYESRQSSHIPIDSTLGFVALTPEVAGQLVNTISAAMPCILQDKNINVDDQNLLLTHSTGMLRLTIPFLSPGTVRLGRNA